MVTPKIPFRFNTNWIPYIAIIVLVLIIFLRSPNGSSVEENKKITESEKKIDEYESMLIQIDSIVVSLTHERDSILTSTRELSSISETKIITKYIKLKDEIINLSDDASIGLLRKNLGAKQ